MFFFKQRFKQQLGCLNLVVVLFRFLAWYQFLARCSSGVANHNQLTKHWSGFTSWRGGLEQHQQKLYSNKEHVFPGWMTVSVTPKQRIAAKKTTSFGPASFFWSVKFTSLLSNPKKLVIYLCYTCNRQSAPQQKNMKLNTSNGYFSSLPRESFRSKPIPDLS